MLSERALLVTGGTGSFGNAMVRLALARDVREVRILSRDEKKQDDMRRRYGDTRLRFILGDVRDPDSVRKAVAGIDYVFHAAALKQVPNCEFHPLEAVRTNVLGTEHVVQASIAAHVKRVVCLSTDKAVYPINAMGMTKALMEKVVVAASRDAEGSETVLCATRYGNVLGSRGSVVPLFKSQIALGRPLTVTDPAMTRFMMTLEDAVELVLYAFAKAQNGDLFVQKAPAATMGEVADAIRLAYGRPDHPISIIGTRHGEKLYETLLSREEMAGAIDEGRYFRVPVDGRDLNYEVYVEQGEARISGAQEYHSHNTTRLSVEEIGLMLSSSGVLRDDTGDSEREVRP